VFVSADPFSKLDSEGAFQWTREPVGQFVSADGLGNVYISSWGGGPEDAFVNKYDSAGNLQWTSRSGISDRDVSRGISADALGNVYIAGMISTAPPFVPPESGPLDVFVSKFDATGNLQWTRQLETPEPDFVFGVSADGLGNVYVSGETRGSLGGPSDGSSDVFLLKYDAAGNLEWSRQIGTATGEAGGNVYADSLGNVYLSGSTQGSLVGGPDAGPGRSDVFLVKFDAAGDRHWTQQLGTDERDYSAGVSADRLGNVYISGFTLGSAGSYDAFVAKYNDFTIPEPASWLLAALASATVLWVGKRRN
jgi:hypothetical protein